MRTIMMLGLLIAVAFMAGWFTIDRSGDTTQITIDKEEIRQDARQAIDRGRDYLDRFDERRDWPAERTGGGDPSFGPDEPRPRYGDLEPRYPADPRDADDARYANDPRYADDARYAEDARYPEEARWRDVRPWSDPRFGQGERLPPIKR